MINPKITKSMAEDILLRINKDNSSAEEVPEMGVPFNPALNPSHKAPEPNVGNAEAKLMQLQQYLDGMGLNNEKWQKYLAEARRNAAVGDDQFNAMPKLDAEDMEYLRAKNQRQQKEQMMGGQVGGTQGI